MKKTFIFAVAILVFASCDKTPTPEQVAQQSIKEYMLADVEEGSKYEPIEFGTLDSLYTSFEPQRERFQRQFEFAKSMFDLALSNYDTPYGREQAEKYQKEMQDINAKWEAAESSFTREWIGFTMTHKFRASDEHLDIIASAVFQLNKELTEVEIKDLTELTPNE